MTAPPWLTTAAAAAFMLLSLSLSSTGSHAASVSVVSTKSSEGDDFHLRRRPVGVTGHGVASTRLNDDDTSSFGSFLRKLLSTSEDDEDVDLRSHYPLFHAAINNKHSVYDMNDVLFSFTITAHNSNVMSRPPPAHFKRKLAGGEAAITDAHSDATHATADDAHSDSTHGGGGGHDDAHSMVVHVTYENIYAILVFLIAATALGIVTSKLGMVSCVKGECFVFQHFFCVCLACF